MDQGHPHLGTTVYRFVVYPNTTIQSGSHSDPRSDEYLVNTHALGLRTVERIFCQDLYFIEGSLNENDLERLAYNLLSDPISQRIEWSRIPEGSHNRDQELDGKYRQIDVALRPGVTDPVAEQIVRAAQVIGITGVCRASTGQRFLIYGEQLDDEVLTQLATRLLANPIIQWFAIGDIEPVFPQATQASSEVELIPIRQMSEEELLRLSAERRTALDLREMQAIQRYYLAEQRDMTDVELETIAQTWSEHCGHKTFKANIHIVNPEDSASPQYQTQTEINNLLKTYLKAATDTINAPWVLSAFVDNAGIIAFNDELEISFKVETHNHPSAIEPFGGANTGVGGVIRDVIGVSAKPIAATDVLCFGPQDLPLDELPAGVLHPRRIQSGVVAGVQDYGNKIGIPTVSGAILYDPGFTANPLVFCGCVGIAPRGKHPNQPAAGDRVIVLGGRTGRDGLRGATFSSMTMDAQTGEVAGASVQIGAPITEKGLIDVIVQARDLGLYHAVTDCGAGGLSSAVGEMASQGGADVDLKHIKLKYPGLAPWEIWLSEAQERMVLAVPEESLPKLQAICQTWDVELTDMGAFNTSGRLVVRYNGQVVLDLANNFLHEGIPQRQLRAELPHKCVHEDTPVSNQRDLGDILLRLLAHPNIASKESTIRIYDHEIQGGTLVKPLTGAVNDGPSDAVVLKPIGAHGTTAAVLANGINPEYGKQNAYRMAFSVIDEAIRNAVAVGADPKRIALLDNFCWGDPLNPQTMGSLVECVRGCHDAAIQYGTPFISGKDSLNNEYYGKDGMRHAIPPTLLISALGIMEDYSRAVTMDLKEAGNLLYLVGFPEPKLSGSHYALVTGESFSEEIPGRSEPAPAVYAALHAAIRARLVRACHDLSEGGLGVAAAEMCIGGRTGLDLRIEAEDPLRALLGETNGCLLVEVKPEYAAAFEIHFAKLPVQLIGAVTKAQRLTVTNRGKILLSLPVDDLVSAWKGKEQREQLK